MVWAPTALRPLYYRLDWLRARLSRGCADTGGAAVGCQLAFGAAYCHRLAMARRLENSAALASLHTLPSPGWPAGPTAGYLPSFWLKLRMTLDAPAINSTLLHGWPVSAVGTALCWLALVAPQRSAAPAAQRSSARAFAAPEAGCCSPARAASCPAFSAPSGKQHRPPGTWQPVRQRPHICW